MKNQLIWLLLTGSLFFTTTGVVKAKPKPTRLFKHIVMITFKEGAPPNEIKEVDDSFQNLANKLTVVKGYEWGEAQAEGQSKTITHVYQFSFASDKDLATYGASPEHQQHIKVGASIVERGQAVDYWVKK